MSLNPDSDDEAFNEAMAVIRGPSPPPPDPRTDPRPVILIGVSKVPDTAEDAGRFLRQLRAELPMYRPVVVENLTGAIVLPHPELRPRPDSREPLERSVHNCPNCGRQLWHEGLCWP